MYSIIEISYKPVKWTLTTQASVFGSHGLESPSNRGELSSCAIVGLLSGFDVGDVPGAACSRTGPAARSLRQAQSRTGVEMIQGRAIEPGAIHANYGKSSKRVVHGLTRPVKGPEKHKNR